MPFNDGLKRPVMKSEKAPASSDKPIGQGRFKWTRFRIPEVVFPNQPTPRRTRFPLARTKRSLR